METPLIPPPAGAIRSDEAYRLDDLKRRLGVNDDCLRKMRRSGLRARKVGRRKLYLGDEVIAFLRQCPEV